MRDKAWIFDVDGVLTDPQTKMVSSAVLHRLVELVNRGDVISFNTGRSVAWIKDRIINPLRPLLSETTFLQDIFAVGEKGATWLAFSQNGNEKRGKDNSFVVQEQVREQVKKLVADQYKDCVFFDETKEVMISIEMHDGFDLVAFHERQKSLATDIQVMLKEFGIQDSVKLDESIIATDIEDMRTDKANGIKKLLHFFAEKGFSPKTFTVFGDSKVDLAMADALFARKKQVQLIFVGEKSRIANEKRDYQISFIPGYSEGTRLFLEKEVKEMV